jgi:hypothetical protein
VLIVSCCLSVAIRVNPWLTAVFRLNNSPYSFIRSFQFDYE